jgi:hypothetical protein
MTTIDHLTGEPRAVADWRLTRATSLGYKGKTAVAIAAASESELPIHEIEKLRLRGCPPRLALRIVKPL